MHAREIVNLAAEKEIACAWIVRTEHYHAWHVRAAVPGHCMKSQRDRIRLNGQKNLIASVIGRSHARSPLARIGGVRNDDCEDDGRVN